MELTFYEDPACTWCWAFQPVSTAFAFEFGETLRPRHVMGGLRDWPAADVGFVMGQWKKAEMVSGMPFESRIWRKHVLKTTFVACRAVKAAGMIAEGAAHRLLRRLRESLFVEQVPIDDVETILRLGSEVGIDRLQLEENIASGRAETLFARDRSEAAQFGFGFPTIVLRDGRVEHPVLLQGAVPYSEVIQTLYALGVSPKLRRRFRDTTEHWASLFSIHRRLTLAEIQKVTQMERAKLEIRLADLGIRKSGVFYEVPSPEVEPEARKAGEGGGTGEGRVTGEGAACGTTGRGAIGEAAATSPEAHPKARPEVHPASDSESHPESHPESHAVSHPESHPESHAEAHPKAHPEAFPETSPGAHPAMRPSRNGSKPAPAPAGDPDPGGSAPACGAKPPSEIGARSSAEDA